MRVSAIQFTIAMFLLSCIPALAQADFQLTGSGGQADLGNNCFRLTQAANTQFGAMWFRRKADLNQEFDLTATLNFGSNNGGADGIVFAFQNLCSNAGGNGGGMGIQGVTPSLFVEFDTYQNTEFSDPSNDHIGILRNGQVNHSAATSLVAPVCALENCGNIETGAGFPVRIHWKPDEQKLDVYFNNVLRSSYTGNVVEQIFSGNPYVYWGFTAATGGLNNVHSVCINSFNNNIIQLSDASICAGEAFQANLPGGTNYSWSPNTFISNTGISNPVLNPPATTTYIVSITDACNNVQTDSITITVNPLPNVDLNLNSPTSLCANSSAFSLSGGSPSGGTYSGNGISGNSFNPAVSGVGTFPISYTISDANGCVNTAVQNLTVNPNPSVNIAVIEALCSNASPVNLVGSPSGGSFSGSGTSGNSFNPSGLSGSVPITYTFTNAQGCSGTALQNVTVNAAPIAQIQSPQGTVICNGSPVGLSVQSQAGVQFEWLRNNTVVSALAAGNTSFSASQAGVYTLRAVGAGNCESLSMPVTITTGNNPTATLSTSDESICPGSSTVINLSATNAAQTAWQLNGATISGQSLSSLSVQSAGVYTAIVTSSDGCSVSSNDLTISTLPVAVADISAEASAFCPFTDNIEIQNAATSGATYAWYLNNQLQAGSGPIFSATEPGSYFLITSLNSCNDTSQTLVLTAGQVPEVTISSESSEICEGSSNPITASGTALGSFVWNINGNPIGGNTAVLEANAAGEYSVTVTSTDGCTATSNSISLSTIPSPVASISASGTFFCPGGTPVVLTANQIQNASYQFTLNGNPVGDASGQNTFTVAQGGVYSVIVSDGQCSSSAQNITITSGNLPSAAGSIFGSSDFCPGEQLDLFIFNVNGASSYLWTVNPASAGTISSGQGTSEITFDALNQSFTVTVTPQNQCGNGQSSTESVSVDNGSFCNFFEVVLAAFPTLTCTGNTVTFYNYSDSQSFFGGTPQWNFGAGASPATATGNGPHSVTYSSAGPKDISLVYVDNFGFEMGSAEYQDYVNVSAGAIAPDISGNSQLISCSGITETYTVANTPGHTYTWTVPANASLSGQGQASVQVTFNGNAGNVSVVETDLAGCSSAAAQFLVECPAGIFESKENQVSIVAYPNPTTGLLQIKASHISGKLEIELFDVRGALLKQSSLHSEGENFDHVIDISDLQAGIYLLRLVNQKGTGFIRIVKQ